MIDFHIHKVGYRGRLVADIETGAIGCIRDKYYSGLYEVWFEYDEFQIDNIISNPEYNRPIEECFQYSPFPNRKFKKANQLILID